LAIVGDNGAGKTTVIKALSGVIKPDSGKIVIGGIPYGCLTPKLAGECGISTVYQDLALVNSENAWENVFLGHEYRRFGWLERKRMKSEASKIIERLGVAIEDLEIAVGNLSGGQRQAISIARALLQGKGLLIFDEPTAAMGYKETIAIQRLMLNLKNQGLGIIIISHNIQQVYDLADRICVMSHGYVVDTIEKTAVAINDVIAMIISGCARNNLGSG
jgi:ABC-type sugar transport system ATPase subunit